MKHAVIILIVALGVGCGTPVILLPAGPLIQLEQRPDGLTYKKGEPEPYTGQLIMTTRGTGEKWVSHYANGIRDGQFAVYYANGKRQAEAIFNKGMSEYTKKGKEIQKLMGHDSDEIYKGVYDGVNESKGKSCYSIL